MNKYSIDNIEPTLEQLKQSVQLLAYSLAQHRENCETIPLINALPFAKKDNLSAHSKPLYKTSNTIYKETLALAERSLKPADSALKELRIQPRINVSNFIKIIVPATGWALEGELSDISWGGLCIHTNELLGNANDLLYIYLPYPEEEDLHIQAKIVRSWKNCDTYSTAIRFTKISHKNEYRLNILLELLLNETDERKRNDTSFAQRINVCYWDDEELKATLEDVSRGGMMITMPEPVELNKSVKVQLDGRGDAYILSLRARVVQDEIITISDFDMHQMAIEFEHPTTELHSIVQDLIQGMMNKEVTNNAPIPILN